MNSLWLIVSEFWLIFIKITHQEFLGDTLLKIANSFLGTGTSTNNGYYSYGNEYDVDGLKRNDVGPSQGSDGLSKGITNVNAAVEFLE